jgi:hypothetical protein
MEKPGPTSFLHTGSCKRLAASLSSLVGRVVLAAAAGFLMLPEARAGEYYWKDWAGANGRWDWGTSQWWYNGGYAVGKPATDGSAMVFFQDTGSTTTYIQTSLNDLVFEGAASKFNSPKRRWFLGAWAVSFPVCR